MKNIKTLLLISSALLGGQTVSVLFHSFLNDSGLFLVFVWWGLLVFALPISLLVCFFAIHKKHPELSIKNSLTTYFLLQLVTVEFIIVTIELLGSSIDSTLSFVSVYFYILVIPFLFQYQLRKYSHKSLYQGGFAFVVVLFIMMYILHPLSGHDICDKISIGMSKTEMITTVEQYIPLTEESRGRNRYFVVSNTPEQDGYFISTNGVFCDINVDKEGRVSATQKYVDGM
jgi:hypothetical protein